MTTKKRWAEHFRGHYGRQPTRADWERFREIVKTREELVEMGRLRDSGRRENGEIIWQITELGKAQCDSLNEPKQ